MQGFWQPVHISKEEQVAEQETLANNVLENPEENTEDVSLSDIADNSAISIMLGYGLVDMVSGNDGGVLSTRVTGIRRQVSKALGFVVPSVRIRDDLTLEPNTYLIKVGHTIVGEDKVYPDRKLAIPGEDVNLKIDGIQVKDPTFGMDAVWINANQTREAETKGYVVVAPDRSWPPILAIWFINMPDN